MQTYLLSLKKAYFSSFTTMPRTCWHGMTLAFIESILGGIFFFLSLYLVNNLHLNINQAGNIVAFFGVGAMLGGIAGGKLSDLISPAKVTATSLVLQGITYLLLIKLTSFYLLAANVFVMGMATYGFITSNYLGVMSQCQAYPQQKLQAINLLSTAANLGSGISALLVSSFIHAGFRPLFAGVGIILILLAAYSLVIATNEEKLTAKKEKNSALAHEHSPLQERIITILLLLCVLFAGSVVAQLGSNYPIYIEQSFPQMGISAVSTLFVLNCALVVIFEIPFGNWFGGYNKILMVGISGFVIGLGMCLLSIAHYFWIAIAAAIIYTLGEIIFFCFAQYALYQKAPEHKKGEKLGLFRMTFAGSRMLGPAAGGYIYHQFGGTYVWYTCGVIGILCLIACLIAKSYD